MWIASKLGFFSIVENNLAEDQNAMIVRARKFQDLENLFDKKRIVKSKNSDYRYRVFCQREEVQELMFKLGGGIDYGNFKDKIKEVKSQADKLPFYNRIWNAMYEYQWQLLGKGLYGNKINSHTSAFNFFK